MLRIKNGFICVNHPIRDIHVSIASLSFKILSLAKFFDTYVADQLYQAKYRIG